MTKKKNQPTLHRIIIHADPHGQPQPVRLHIGGRAANASRALPVNRTVHVDDAELAALRNSDHFIEILGSTVADEAEQAPAPAGSGDGGDAGGGGDSGEPAADTSDAPADATHDPSAPEQSPQPEATHAEGEQPEA